VGPLGVPSGPYPCLALPCLALPCLASPCLVLGLRSLVGEARLGRWRLDAGHYGRWSLWLWTLAREARSLTCFRC